MLSRLANTQLQAGMRGLALFEHADFIRKRAQGEPAFATYEGAAESLLAKGGWNCAGWSANGGYSARPEWKRSHGTPIGAISPQSKRARIHA